MQNRSHAVMAQRSEAKDSRDDFPTPPWATRAMLEHVLLACDPEIADQTCLEPACGAGHMDKVLNEYFSSTSASDVHDYGYGKVENFLNGPHAVGSFDWVITNPPFNLAEEFVARSLQIARRGVAILARTVFIESVGRYERLFLPTPPSIFAQYVERVPMVKGRLDPKASTATGYAWFIWQKGHEGNTELRWIPPCRKHFERLTDYQLPASKVAKECRQAELFDLNAYNRHLEASG